MLAGLLNFTGQEDFIENGIDLRAQMSILLFCVSKYREKHTHLVEIKDQVQLAYVAEERV